MDKVQKPSNSKRISDDKFYKIFSEDDLEAEEID
jgi:hypothetical protein